MLIHIDDMRAGYQKILGHVVMRGRHVAPRGKQTLELPSTTIHLTDPTACIATGISRGFSMKFAYAEAIQLLGGFSDVPQFCDWFPQMKAFLDDGIMDAKSPRRRRGDLAHLVDDFVRPPDQLGAVAQEALAELREANAACVAMKERCPDEGLELLDARGDDRA